MVPALGRASVFPNQKPMQFIDLIKLPSAVVDDVVKRLFALKLGRGFWGLHTGAARLS